MRRRIARGEKVAVLFGRERWGLNNDEVSLADVIVTAPVNPAFASINIAQAVLLMGYEWYKEQAETLGQQTPELPALEGPGLQTPDTRPATKEEFYGFLRPSRAGAGYGRVLQDWGQEAWHAAQHSQSFRPGRTHRAGGPQPSRHRRLADPCT